MVVVSDETLGTKASTERSSRVRGMGKGHATSWHPTARHGGGTWAVLTNSLPRSVPRMGQRSQALPLLTGTVVVAKARPRGAGAREARGGPEVQVQAAWAEKKARRTRGAGTEQAQAVGEWAGGGGRGSRILPAQDPRG